MDALLDATDSQMAALADLVEALAAADATVNAMMAARDGLLAMAGRIVGDISERGEHPESDDMTMRVVAAEIGQRLRVSDRTVERRIAQAACLVDAFPEVWRAQGAGLITAAHAHVIVEAGAHLHGDERTAYATVVMPLAEVESPNRLRPLAKRIAERFREMSIDERHQKARVRRRVWTADQDDAMADLTMHGPAVLVHAMMDRLSQMAHALRTTNVRAEKEARAAGVEHEADLRSVDEIRADLLTDLVLTGTPAGHDTDGLLGEVRGRIEITVPVTTLMGADLGAGDTTGGDADSADAPDGDDVAGADSAFAPPGLLDGAVPIDTRTARMLAGTATGWDRVLTHPLTGAVLAADRYRPPEGLRRHLRARDQRCRFPTCGLPARRCDLDHTHPAASGGETTADNLGAFCRRHHTLKHASPWHVSQRAGGVLEWTSPTGRTYVDIPPPPNTVVFASSSDAWLTIDELLDDIRAPF